MRQTIKKILAVSAIVFGVAVLAGCGTAEKETGGSGLQAYDGGEYILDIDPAWRVLTPSDFYAEIPKETLVAFTAPETANGFFTNVNVVREDLGQEAASLDYARANINLSAQNLTDYKKIQEAKTAIGESPTLVHIFEARLNPSEKLIRFVQLYATQGRYGYIVTGGMFPDTPKETRDKVGSMVTSFRLK